MEKLAVVIVTFPAFIVLLLISSVSQAAPHIWVQPRATPKLYTSANYGITFRVPQPSTYCPLPDDWAGSDHGTTVFLQRPKRCGGSGFPSSSRGYEPGDLATIDLFYAYWLDDIDVPASPCHRVATTLFLGTRRPVCEERKAGQITRTVTARYQADVPAQAILTLTTRKSRLQTDMMTFQQAAATARPCKAFWTGPKGRFTIGSGLPCPKGGRWF